MLSHGGWSDIPIEQYSAMIEKHESKGDEPFIILTHSKENRSVNGVILPKKNQAKVRPGFGGFSKGK